MLFYRNGQKIANDDFSQFLTFNDETVNANSPNLYVTYNPNKSEIHIVIKVSKEGGTPVPQILVIPIVAQQQYRIGVNISDKLAEVYKDGIWMKTIVFGGNGTPSGTNTDKFVYTPYNDV